MPPKGRIWQELTWTWAFSTGHLASDQKLAAAAEAAWPYALLYAWTYLNDHDAAQHVLVPEGTIVLGEAKKIGSNGFGQATVTARVMALETQHKERRSWVWARSGQSPWAMALEPLVALAKLSKSPIGGPTVDAAATSYASDGYRCDQAALYALSRFRETTSDAAIMKRAVRALYEPWLDASARHFQELVQKAGKLGSPPIVGERDACVLFVDGFLP
jgi:hypothetical protein